MSFTLSYPTVPTNGQPLDATQLLANLVAISQAIASFDGAQIQSSSIVEAAFTDAVNPRLRASETIFDHVASGCVWSADSAGASLNGSMTSGFIYINGYRTSLGAISAHAFAASKDTYIDVDYLGNFTYSAVTNNAASPSLAANSIRLGIVVTGAGSIAAATSINQGNEGRVLPIASSIPYQITDSIGNLICPRDPTRHLLGLRIITSSFVTTTAGSLVDVTGINMNVIVPAGRKIYAVVTAPETKSSQSAGNGIYAFVTDVTAGANIGNSHIDTPTSSYSVNSSFTTVPYTPATSGVRNFKLGGKQDAAGTLTFTASVTNPVGLAIYMA